MTDRWLHITEWQVSSIKTGKRGVVRRKHAAQLWRRRLMWHVFRNVGIKWGDHLQKVIDPLVYQWEA